MGKPSSLDFRKRVAPALAKGVSCNQVAKQFGIGVSTAIGWARRLRETGSIESGQIGGYKPKAISGEHASWLSRRIKSGDFTLRGLVGELAECGLNGHNHGGNFGAIGRKYFVNFKGMVETPDTTAFSIVEVHDDRIDIRASASRCLARCLSKIGLL